MSPRSGMATPRRALSERLWIKSGPITSAKRAGTRSPVAIGDPRDRLATRKEVSASGAKVPEQLAQIFRQRYETRVVGTFSPPFRSLTPKEAEEVKASIHAAAPDVLWVGLSTPKQERRMFEFRPMVRVPVMVGVGAAFDLNTGGVRQAPVWMREHGLEWLFRLLVEPRRLWRRYLIGGSEFLWLVALELAGLKKFA